MLSAKQLGAERIIAMSRHERRQKLALDFGATDIVEERGDEGVARVKDLTDGWQENSNPREQPAYINTTSVVFILPTG